MEKKDIKEIQFTFENCENITIPIKCFKTLKYTIHKNCITYFNADIINNTNILYGITFGRNSITPIQRIALYNDITHIDFIKTNNTVERYYTIYHDKKYNEDDNDYQYIKQSNLTYCFNELFTFPVGTCFKSSHNILYTIQKDKLGKYLSSGNCDYVKIHKSMINDTYIKLNKRSI